MTPAPESLPALARLIVRLVTPRERRAAVEGDLAELRASRRAIGRRDLGRALAGDLASLGWAALRRRLREIRGGAAGLGGDLRLAVRSARKQPGYALLAAGTLALGIASATTVFSIGDRVLLRPLPYPHPERLYAIEHAPFAFPPSGGIVVSRRIRELPEFDAAASYIIGGFNLGADGSAARVAAAAVTPAFFATMGVAPIYGRTFTDDEERTQARAAVISYDLWRGRLGGARDLVGREITLNGRRYLVVGIMPARFAFPAGVDVWTTSNADQQMAGQAAAPDAIARLKDGVTITQAHAALDRANAAMGAPEGSERTRLRSLHAELTAEVRPVLILLSCAVALLLVVTCGNVSGLALSRLVMRQRELVVRRALGATSSRLIRLVTIEALTITAAGTIAGVPAAFWLTQAATALSPVALPEFDLARVDVRMLLVAAAIASICGLVVGIGPAAAAARAEAAGVLRSSVTTTAPSTWWRGALVAGQVAAAVVLIVAAMATWTTLRGLLDVDSGLHPTATAQVAELTLPLEKYPDNAAVTRFYDALAVELRSRGATRVAAANYYPGSAVLGVGYGLEPVETPLPADAPRRRASWISVSDQYFDLLGIPIVRGRTFTAADRTGAPLVAIVSAATASALFPDASNPIGLHVATKAGTTTRIFEIVGIAADARFAGPKYLGTSALYVSFAQQSSYGGFSLLFDAGTRGGVARDALSAVDPGVPAYGVRPLQSALDRFVARERLSLFVCAAFAGMTIALVTIGLYGVLAQSVARRRREIGLRLALGANRARVQWLIVRDGQMLVAGGVVAGVAAAWLLMRSLAAAMPDLSVPPPSAFAVPVALLLAVGVVAAWMPARRAARIDPLSALKEL